MGGWEQGGRVVIERKILENKYILNVFPEETLKVDEGDGSGVFLGELTFLQKKIRRKSFACNYFFLIE